MSLSVSSTDTPTTTIGSGGGVHESDAPMTTATPTPNPPHQQSQQQQLQQHLLPSTGMPSSSSSSSSTTPSSATQQQQHHLPSPPDNHIVRVHPQNEGDRTSDDEAVLAATSTVATAAAHHSEDKDATVAANMDASEEADGGENNNNNSSDSSSSSSDDESGSTSHAGDGIVDGLHKSRPQSGVHHRPTMLRSKSSRHHGGGGGHHSTRHSRMHSISVRESPGFVSESLYSVREHLTRFLLFFSFQSLLEPNARVKITWDWYIILLALYQFFITTWYIAFDTDLGRILYGFDWFVTMSFILDILITFRTGYIDYSGHAIFDSRLIGERYIHSFFIIDLLGTIPFHVFSPLIHFEEAQRNSSGSATQFVDNCLKLNFLLRTSKIINSVRIDSFISPQARIGKLLFGFFCLAHLFGSIFWFVGCIQTTDQTWIHLRGLENKTHLEQYVSSLYWALTTMVTVGYGDIVPSTVYEQATVIPILMLSALIYATIFGNMAYAIETITSTIRRYQSRMDSIKEFVKVYELPKELQQKLYDYTNAQWTQTKGFETNEMLSHLPTSVRADILMFIQRNLIERVPLFKQCSDRFLEAMILRMSSQVCLTGDYIFKEGDKSREMYFVRSGSVEIIMEVHGQDRNIADIGSYSDYPFFGEISLLLGETRTASARAATKCVLSKLSQQDFFEVLSMFPEEENSLRETATLRLEQDIERETKLQKRERPGFGVSRAMTSAVNMMNGGGTAALNGGRISVSQTMMQTNGQAFGVIAAGNTSAVDDIIEQHGGIQLTAFSTNTSTHPNITLTATKAESRLRSMEGGGNAGANGSHSAVQTQPPSPHNGSKLGNNGNGGGGGGANNTNPTPNLNPNLYLLSSMTSAITTSNNVPTSPYPNTSDGQQSRLLRLNSVAVRQSVFHGNNASAAMTNANNNNGGTNTNNNNSNNNNNNSKVAGGNVATPPIQRTNSGSQFQSTNLNANNQAAAATLISSSTAAAPTMPIATTATVETPSVVPAANTLTPFLLTDYTSPHHQTHVGIEQIMEEDESSFFSSPGQSKRPSMIIPQGLHGGGLLGGGVKSPTMSGQAAPTHNLMRSPSIAGVANNNSPSPTLMMNANNNNNTAPPHLRKMSVAEKYAAGAITMPGAGGTASQSNRAMSPQPNSPSPMMGLSGTSTTQELDTLAALKKSRDHASAASSSASVHHTPIHINSSLASSGPPLHNRQSSINTRGSIGVPRMVSKMMGPHSPSSPAGAGGGNRSSDEDSAPTTSSHAVGIRRQASFGMRDRERDRDLAAAQQAKVEMEEKMRGMETKLNEMAAMMSKMMMQTQSHQTQPSTPVNVATLTPS